MNFKINLMERNTDGGVKVVHWSVNKAQGENVAATSGITFVTPDPDADGYIPYDSLTEATVIGWVQNAIDTTELESQLDTELAELATPTTLEGLPW